MASIERSQNNCDLATPAYIRKLYLPVARKHSTYTNVMHDKYSTCKHEHATCTCQIVTAQIADAGQLQDNESRPFFCMALRSLRCGGAFAPLSQGKKIEA